jgi:hypothetical protein
MKNKEEKSAKGVKGFLLYNPFQKCHIFRVYDKQNKKEFIDYKIIAEDIEIKINSDFYALIKQNDHYFLDYSKKALKKEN